MAGGALLNKELAPFAVMRCRKGDIMIYFDNSATTKIAPEALQSYVQTSERFWGNPSSLHRLGGQAFQVLEKAREHIATLLGAKTEEIYITSGGTESNNWAIKGTALEKRVFGNHIITTKIEHPSVLNTVKQLAQLGFEISYLDVNDKGEISLEQLESMLKKETILVSVMAVNNEIGVSQNIEEISRILEHYPWVHFHVDAVQALEQVPDLLALGRIDLLSLSAHKFHGPRGVGILYKKAGRKIQSLLTGGGQEKTERSTTENLPGIVATAKAMRMYLEAPHPMKEIRDYLWNFLEKQPQIKIFSPKEGVDHILCFALKGVRGEVLVHAFEEEEIYISTTSACSSKKSDSSSTLAAMNVPDYWATSAVRASFSYLNTMDEAKQFVEVLEKLMKKFEFLK